MKKKKPKIRTTFSRPPIGYYDVPKKERDEWEKLPIKL